MYSVLVHRRDLRTVDNAALDRLRLTHPGLRVVHAFVLDPRQSDPRRNPYYGRRAFRFMMECVRGIEGVEILRGGDESALARLRRKHGGDWPRAVAFNLDYTPFARARDARLVAWCAAQGIDVVTAEDYTLFPRGLLRPNKKTHYEVFTPFYRRALAQLDDDGAVMSTTRRGVDDEGASPHRRAALAILARVRAGEFRTYGRDREFPALDRTTRLSVYLKFGCVSVREAMSAARASGSPELVRELLWREFCAQLVAGTPRVLAGQAAGARNESVRADRAWVVAAPTLLRRWKDGTTGFPIVDASMRCLNATGFLHNRCRMIVASFLCKDMRVDWREGERYFATQLIDYDPASNSFGWQWSAGVGADAPPFSRVFNPWLQSAKYDADAAFIRRWVPELRAVAPAHVHDPAAASSRRCRGYPAPMLDHAQAVRALKSAALA